MDRIKYEKLLNDEKTIKIFTVGGCFFHDRHNEIAISFCFMYYNPFENYPLKPDKRIYLSVYPFQNLLNEISTKLLEKETLILVNADIFEYALTFTISIDILQRLVVVKIHDKPEMGENFITQEEKEGIRVQYEDILA